MACAIMLYLYRDQSGYMVAANERGRYIVTSSLIDWAHIPKMIHAIYSDTNGPVLPDITGCPWVSWDNLAHIYLITGI